MTQELTYVPVDDIFETSDIGLAAALCTIGFKVTIEKVHHGQAFFSFKKSERIEYAIAAYFDDELKVRARSMHNNTKMLKQRIRSSQL